MTAEIALINRSALALAADSAATLRIGSQSKTYNSAEKIFEFSCEQPIALMIYNNVEYIGVPLDVLIRKYRSDNKNKFETLREAADNFTKYLLQFERRNSEDEKYLAGVLLEIFKRISSEWEIAERTWRAAGEGGQSINLFTSRLEEVLDEQLHRYETTQLPNFLEDKSLDEFIEVYRATCEEVIETAFQGLEVKDGHRNKLYRLAFAVVRSSIGSDLLTGLVFGGYGLTDLFPTLHYLRLDGTYFGRHKILNRDEVDINRGSQRAAMVPFAQSDMAERFIYGLDIGTTRHIEKIVNGAIGEIAQNFRNAFTSDELHSIKETVSAGFTDALIQLKRREQQDILDIVNFMSKKELGELAHALVELTSAKRRFSIAQETVGGPIDVAIISRSEGFIWIRRKQYFEAVCNPGYFARVYPTRHNGGRNEDK